jgi:hypothetical protein
VFDPLDDVARRVLVALVDVGRGDVAVRRRRRLAVAQEQGPVAAVAVAPLDDRVGVVAEQEVAEADPEQDLDVVLAADLAQQFGGEWTKPGRCFSSGRSWAPGSIPSACRA